MPTTIRRLVPADAPAYRALMLEAYADPAGTFTATVAEREGLPLAWWEARLADAPEAVERVLGAFDGAALAGVVGLRLRQRPRTRHKATLFGLAVRPAHRGRGLGRRLVEAVLTEVASVPGLRVVQLTVTETNAPALRLYERCGFAAFGTEPMAVRVGDGYLGKVHMWRRVPPRRPGPRQK